MRSLSRSAPWYLFMAWIALELCACAPAIAGVSAAKYEYRISGVVVSSRDGAPVARCHVEVLAEAQQTQERRFRPGSGEDRAFSPGASEAAAATQEATTDTKGRFSIEVAHAGLWRLRATGRGFRPQGYDQHGNFTSMIALTEAAPEASVTFRIAPEAVISGRVFDEAGEAVRMAQVRLEMLRKRLPGEAFRGGQSAGFTQSDDRGRYEFSGLGPGEYRVMVQVSPWYSTLSHVQSNTGDVSPLDPTLDVVYPTTWYPGVTDQAAAGVIHLHGGEEQQADFNLSPVASIHLKIPQEPAVAGAGGRRSAQVHFPSISDAVSVQSNPNQVVRLDEKTWEVGGLAPGTYQIRLPQADGANERSFNLKVAAGSPTTLGLEAAVEELTVTVILKGSSSRQTVTLINPDTGQAYPVAGGRRQNGGPRDASHSDGLTTEDDAEARRTVHLPPHRYEVRVLGPGDTFITGLSATDAQVSGRTVEISGGAPVLTISMATGRAQVSGVARIKNMVSAGAMVLLVPAAYGQAGGDPVLQAETNTDGSFRLRNVVPGPYLLVAIDHGWSINWEDPATLARYLIDGIPFELKPGADFKQDIVALTP